MRVTIRLFLVVSILQISCLGGTKEQLKKTSDLTASQAVEKIRPSVVQIIAEGSYGFVGNPRRIDFHVIAGSGFFGDTLGHIITARHIVIAIDSLPSKIIREVGSSVDPNSIMVRILVGLPVTEITHGPNRSFENVVQISARIIKRSEKADAAIIEVPAHALDKAYSNGLIEEPSKNIKLTTNKPIVPIFDTEPADEGEMIAVSGFPLSIPAMVTNFGWIGSAFGVLPRVSPDDPDQFGQIGAIQINHGNSGGPVYRVRDGAVIGIAVSYWNAPADVSVSIDDSLFKKKEEKPEEKEMHPKLPEIQTLFGNANVNSGLTAIVPIEEALRLLSTH
jgi:S1-C subfamily serine protease